MYLNRRVKVEGVQSICDSDRMGGPTGEVVLLIYNGACAGRVRMHCSSVYADVQWLGLPPPAVMECVMEKPVGCNLRSWP